VRGRREVEISSTCTCTLLVEEEAQPGSPRLGNLKKSKKAPATDIPGSKKKYEKKTGVPKESESQIVRRGCWFSLKKNGRGKPTGSKFWKEVRGETVVPPHTLTPRDMCWGGGRGTMLKVEKEGRAGLSEGRIRATFQSGGTGGCRGRKDRNVGHYAYPKAREGLWFKG